MSCGESQPPTSASATPCLLATRAAPSTVAPPVNGRKRHVYHPFWKRHSLKHCSLTSCAQLLSTPAIGPIPQAAQRTQASTARHPHSHRPPVAGCTGWKGVTACSSPGISSLFTQPRSHRPPVARCTGWKGTNSITSSITNTAPGPVPMCCLWHNAQEKRGGGDVMARCGRMHRVEGCDGVQQPRRRLRYDAQDGKVWGGSATDDTVMDLSQFFIHRGAVQSGWTAWQLALMPTETSSSLHSSTTEVLVDE
eukprot:1162150-Pelagomonas_calceolata.AAC.2